MARFSKIAIKSLCGLAALSLLAAGCRGSAEAGDGEDPGGAQTGIGVTSEPCPQAINADNGCIYLGTISDLVDGPFAQLAIPITEAQEKFWTRVNEQGGIGGNDIDVTTYVGDNKYNPEIHSQVYAEIKDEVLALAQTLGSAPTASVLDDMRANDIVAAPVAYTSREDFEDVIVESGSNLCYESMNLIDYAVEEYGGKTLMSIHYDAAEVADGPAGAKIAADEHGMTFIDVPTKIGPENQDGAIDQIISKKPDLVHIVTAPKDAGTIIGQAAARGYEGMFLGSLPTWNQALLESPAAEVIKTQYVTSALFAPWHADTPGHQAMRESLGDVTPNDGALMGWVFSYPLKAALERAAENGNLTRQGLLEAVKSLRTVDYEGILPPEAGNYAPGGESIFRKTIILTPDESAPTGVTVAKDFFAGPTASKTTLDKPCFQS